MIPNSELSPRWRRIRNIFLVFAITIVLVAVLFSGPPFWEESEEITPTIGSVATFGNYSINVDKIDPGPVLLNDSSCYVLDPNGAKIEGLEFMLPEIRNLGVWSNGTNISYLDNDDDWNISAGDSVHIRDVDDDGLAYDGCRFVFIYEPTGKKMNGAGNKLG